MSEADVVSLRPAKAGGDPHDELRGIQDVAAQLGVTMRTLRFYEDKGLIEPKRVGSTRVYTKREVGRIQLILRGKRLGFSLREIQSFLDLYDADPQHQEQLRLLVIAVRDRISHLRSQKRALDQTLAELIQIEREANSALPEEARPPRAS